MCTLFVQILIQEWHVLSIERSLTIPVLEESKHSSRMNDLVARTESHVEEVRYGYRWYEIS